MSLAVLACNSLSSKQLPPDPVQTVTHSSAEAALLVGSDWDDWPAVPPVAPAPTPMVAPAPPPNEDDGITFDPRGLAPFLGDASAGYRLALIRSHLSLIACCLSQL